ncbi:MAG: RNA polymerase factor sigma-54 [Pseudomonadota bacterium]
MALSPKLELRQGQSLVMTPQLQQAIKMLQWSNIDLAAYLESELERNPLLEREDENGTLERQNSADEVHSSTSEGGEFDEGLASPPDSLDVSIGAKEADLDADRDVLYSEDAPSERAGTEMRDGPSTGSLSDPTSGSRSFSGANLDSLESTLTNDQSLNEHLHDQLMLAKLSPSERLIGHAIIEEVDDAGYFRVDLESFSSRIGASVDLVDGVLQTLKGFDPSGVFASTLSECLALQLRDRNRLDPAMATLLDNLDMLARRDFGKLRSLCEVDQEDFADMIMEIQSLDPKPGLKFDGSPIQSVAPDVIVTRRHDGGWGIELNTEMLPKVLVNQTYYAAVSKTAGSENDKAYISEHFQDATWLVKSLEQRARTILKVSTEIVRQQDGFLNYGVSHLRPLNLKTIADAISMHESTVSRVTSNKYMATPRGLFELKYFFSAAIASTTGDACHSAESVRHTIRTLIDQEEPKSILSDDTIVQILRERGIDIARRTVAKYREAMRIPSSVQRRREKRTAIPA